jgi:hypothetical protein
MKGGLCDHYGYEGRLWKIGVSGELNLKVLQVSVDREGSYKFRLREI